MSLTGIIIDDEIDVSESMQAYLEIKGFRMLGIAKDGNDGANLYEKTKPDFVILDLSMPKYDGYYAIEKILQTNPKALIFVVTGQINYKKLESKVTAIIEKPFPLQKLSNMILEKFCLNDV